MNENTRDFFLILTEGCIKAAAKNDAMGLGYEHTLIFI